LECSAGDFMFGDTLRRHRLSPYWLYGQLLTGLSLE
jgi:hypothetical protein